MIGNGEVAATERGLDVARLNTIAYNVRRHVLHMAAVKRVHIGPAFSSVELLTLLYGRQLRIDPRNPRWPERDRFILSKGHGALALYGVLAEVGLLPAEQLATFGQPGSALAGHPVRGIAGIEIGTGALGHGLAVGAGMALAGRLDRRDYKTIVLMGDGELNEGSVWETALFAAHWSLDRLIAVVDRNGYQQEGPTSKILETEPLAEKWRAFGWHVTPVDGHDWQALAAAFDAAEQRQGQPTLILARTVKGKGVSFMEHDPAWHMGWLEGDLLPRALAALDGEAVS